MTSEERWQIEGRTRDQLRQAKKDLAALRIDIEEYAKKLEELSGTIRHFLGKPMGEGPTGMTSLQYALHFFRDAISADMQGKLREFEKESQRVLELEQRVKEFEL